MSSMANFDGVLLQLKNEREQLSRAIAALEGVVGNGVASKSTTGRRISTEGRRRIAAAQKARWAKVRAQQNVAVQGKKTGPKRVLSPAARKRIAAGQRARWAAFRKQRKAA
jgi:hypothetical protein